MLNVILDPSMIAENIIHVVKALTVLWTSIRGQLNASGKPIKEGIVY